MGKAYNRMPRPIHTILGASVVCLLAMTTSDPVLGQQVNQFRGPAGCIPISERKMELGCYVVTAEALGELPRTQLYWQIVSYPTRSAADAAKEARGTVVEAIDQIWLMTIAEAGYRPTGGTHIAEIGPLSTKAGTKYTATYMQGIMMPGADTPVHYHAGPEALYTLAGEECMETTEGKFVSRPGGTPIIVPGETSHKLTIIGTTQRRSLALILADSAQPLMLMGAHDHNWTPKGLCKAE